MRKLATIAILVLVAGGTLLIPRCTGDSPEEIVMPLPEHRVVDIADVLAYAGGRDTAFRVRTTRDVLPGGLSAAMAPVMVDWPRSDVGEGGALILGNISHGGNPLSGETLLRSARIHPERIEAIQFVTVPLGGHKDLVHGQLRCVFEPGGIELLGGDAGQVGEPETINDLIFSWEAWRPPGVGYDIMTGMDASVYELSLRCYSGPQRFLEDMLADRPWTAYDLQLPGGRAGLAELLRVTLVMGDGAARQVIGSMLDQAEEAWREANPEPSTDELGLVEAWLQLQTELEVAARDAGDQRLELTGEQTGYQSLLRSCATMALYSIDVAVARQIEVGADAGAMRPTRDPELMDDPAWMTGLASAGWGRLLLNAPRALRFLRANPWIVPGKIPGLLDRSGLLVQEDGEPRRQEYSLAGITPWGHRDQLLIR